MQLTHHLKAEKTSC